MPLLIKNQGLASAYCLSLHTGPFALLRVLNIDTTNCEQQPGEGDVSAYLMFTISSPEGTESGGLAESSLKQISRADKHISNS